MRRVIPLLLLVGCGSQGGPADVPETKTAHLAWEYTDAQIAEANVVGYRVYEGVQERCTAAGFLDDEVGIAPASDRFYVRHGVPIATGLVCYEVTAYNEFSESAHSDRASTQAEWLP